MSSKLIFILGLACLGLAVCSFVQPPQVNTRPIIGIYTAPSEYEGFSPEKYSYIAASYIKYVEAAGAQAVPIPYDATTEYLDTLFSKINGILFPGGDVEFAGDAEYQKLFISNAVYLVQKAKNATDAGDFFPIWGTCMGFQLLSYIESGLDLSVLVSGFNDTATHVLEQVDTSSYIFRNMSSYFLNHIQTVPSVYYHHNTGVKPTAYLKNEQLASNLRFTSLGQNSKGQVFTATLEGIDYPIFGSQFHPEKNLFEWKVAAPHDIDSVEIAQYFLNFFGNLTRSNTHSFNGTADEDQYLMYQYPVYSIDSSSFTQIYIIPNFKLEPSTNTTNNGTEKMNPPQRTVIETMLFSHQAQE